MRQFGAACLLLALTGCWREQRPSRPAPGAVVVFGNAARESDLQPGGPQSQSKVVNPYHGNAWAISEGQRLFGWYNCTGCHANGGGGIGPPLIKKDWTYGGEDANLFDTIVKGRPNGMPAWGGRIPEYQIWQLATYIRSLNQQDATPPRLDTIEPNPATLTNKTQGVTK